MNKKPPFTKEKDFVHLMKEVYEGWKEVREYDDRHLYYDRSKWITDGIDEEWWEFPDEYDRDTDTQTLCLLFEQYLRFTNIVKDTKIGLLPKVDGVNEKKRITEKDTEDTGDKIETIDKLSDYLLSR
ncbi:hypothetical protein N9C41_00470 [Candidatus Marinimicrobia bacterium]|nr:hypothetical protein [Candidatus Neomarinimicrobiota bacterium]